MLLTVNEKRCKPPLADSEVAGIARNISRYPVEKGSSLQAERLLGLVAESQAEPFRSPEEDPFIALPIGRRTEVLPLSPGSQKVRHWLAREFRSRYGQIPGLNQVKQAVDFLAARRKARPTLSSRAWPRPTGASTLTLAMRSGGSSRRASPGGVSWAGPRHVPPPQGDAAHSRARTERRLPGGPSQAAQRPQGRGAMEPTERQLERMRNEADAGVSGADLYLDKRRAAAYLCISVAFLERLMPGMPRFRLGRKVLFKKSELDACGGPTRAPRDAGPGPDRRRGAAAGVRRGVAPHCS